MSLGKHATAFARTRMNSDEQIVISLAGMRKGDSFGGELILTNQRLCFFRKGIIGERIETVPLDLITSVETKSTLGSRHIKAFTAQDSLAFWTVAPKDKYLAFNAALEDLRRKRGPAVSAAAAAPAASIADELGKLAALHERGLLTRDEFDSQKAALLKQ